MESRWLTFGVRRSLGRSLALLVAAGILQKLLDLAFVELNRRSVILPHFDVTLIPYHDPRVTRRHHLLLDYERNPRIIFTGDSRTKNGVVPQVMARILGVDPESFFNFGTGSQVLRFAREAFLPHLLEIGVRPRHLAFCVSPDWPLAKEIGGRLLDRYRKSLAYRMSHPDPDEKDRLERTLDHFLARNLAFFRYRSDLVHREILPDLRCWFLNDCHLSAVQATRPLRFKEVEFRDGYVTPYGWNPQAWDGTTTGRHGGRVRFDSQTPFDADNLTRLIDEVRAAGINPILLLLPVHASFREVHGEAMNRNLSRLREIANRLEVDLLAPAGEYSDPGLFTDGHHLSLRGAVYFSAGLAPDLRRYLGNSSGTPAQAHPQADAGELTTDELVDWIFRRDPVIRDHWREDQPERGPGRLSHPSGEESRTGWSLRPPPGWWLRDRRAFPLPASG